MMPLPTDFRRVKGILLAQAKLLAPILIQARFTARRQLLGSPGRNG
jgi:hypothetical protein